MARNEIIITNKDGGRGGTRTSAINGVQRATQNTTTLKGVPNKASSLGKLFGGNMGGALGKAGIAVAIVKKVVDTTLKGVSIAVDINQAITGDDIYAHNVKSSIAIIKNPFNFIKEATYGEFLRQQAVNRQNIRQAYYRDLMGNITYSKQYGDKR